MILFVFHNPRFPPLKYGLPLPLLSVATLCEGGRAERRGAGWALFLFPLRVAIFSLRDCNIFS